MTDQPSALVAWQEFHDKVLADDGLSPEETAIFRAIFLAGSIAGIQQFLSAETQYQKARMVEEIAWSAELYQDPINNYNSWRAKYVREQDA